MLWEGETLPPWFWDQHDAYIMRRDVTTMGSVPYHVRVESRIYYEARRNAKMKVAAEHKIAASATLDI